MVIQSQPEIKQYLYLINKEDIYNEKRQNAKQSEYFQSIVLGNL